jgi:predicted  nucleic acid-binding Zn-ribbon protein
MTDEDKRLRERVAKGGEEAIGRIAQELLENPMVTGALSAVFETRERATRAQEVAMSALNLPSASDLERLTRRLRAVSQRLEALEDGIDGLQDRFGELGSLKDLDGRLSAIEASLGRIEAGLGKGAATRTARSSARKPKPPASPDVNT